MKTHRGIAWLGGLFLAAIVAQAAYEIVSAHRDAVQGTERELDAQSRVIAEQTARAVQAIDVVLDNLVEQLQSGALAHASGDELHAYLHERAKGLVQSDGLVVINADGSLRAVSHLPAAQLPARNLSAEPTFVRIRDKTDGGLYIGTTLVSPGTQRWVFPIGRRLVDARGEFAGLVGAVGRVDYFQQFYRETYPDPSTRVSLMHRDGTLMARNPPVDAALGKPVNGLATLLPRSTTEPAAARRIPSPVDGIDHFVALRLVPDYPLAVAVSREASAALEPWRNQAIATAWRTLALVALAAGLLAVVLRQLERLRNAGAALELSQERYELAVTGSRGGHWVWDVATDSLFVSDSMNELFGLPPETKATTRDAYFAQVRRHPDDSARIAQLNDDLLSGRAVRADHEFRILLPDGSTRWILSRAQRFAGADGQGLRIAGVSVDISERKQAELEREQLEVQLRQAQKLEAIGTLAGGIAHDFNNILSAILGYGELVQREAGEGTRLRRHIDAAMSASQRAKSLVERILAFSRSGIGERVPVHVRSVLDEALDAVATSLPPGVRLTRAISTGDAGVLGDPTQLHQVVLNLCANAVQAMKDHGELEVTANVVQLDAPKAVATSTLAAGAYVCLSVRDTGSGIAPQLLERIFDPFFTTKQVGVGTGLGLSLVHGIVTDLGGGIAVQSVEGAGSTFTVWLPWRHYTAAPAVAEVPMVQGRGETVLLVDDEEALVRLGEEMLAELGYEPVGFASSEAALAAFRAEPDRFDALLSDETMPGLTGTELAREIRSLRAGLPIVLMSGYVNAPLAQRAQDLGVLEVLAKPLSARDIARSLAAALRRGVLTTTP